MATLKFTHLSSKMLIKALGTLTMNGSIGNAYVIAEPVDKAILVINDAALTGNLTVTVAGSTSADGTSGFTTIKTHVFTSGGQDDFAVELDSEEVSFAQDQAGIAAGSKVEFKTVVFRLTGTNTNTVKAAVVVQTFHQRGDLTPTGTGTLT
jgi:hypothetical protein